MYISRITIIPGFDSLELYRNQTANEYEGHRFIWKFFPATEKQPRDFLYLKYSERGKMVYYMISARKPESRHSRAKIETKKYAPLLQAKDRLQFKARLNPVICRKSEERRTSVRHDVWQDAKQRGRAKSLQGFELREFIRAEVKDWLLTRCEAKGFHLEPGWFDIEGYGSNRLRKPGQKQPIIFNSIDYTGILEVTDPEKFTETLYTGMGKSKAFGCGLFLIKRT